MGFLCSLPAWGIAGQGGRGGLERSAAGAFCVTGSLTAAQAASIIRFVAARISPDRVSPCCSA